jgi:hypothetical protein
MQKSNVSCMQLAGVSTTLLGRRVTIHNNLISKGERVWEDVRWGVLKFQVFVSARGQSALHEVARLCSGGLVGGGNDSMLS